MPNRFTDRLSRWAEGYAAWCERHADAFQTIRNSILQAIFAGIAVCSFLLLMTIVYKGYFNTPPVLVQRLNNEDLGELCPGDFVPIVNRISIEHPIVLLMYVSTLDANATHSVNDTQISFKGRPHPKQSKFMQSLPWYVPDLPVGTYTRVLAIRGTNGAEDPIFVQSTFTVKEKDKCQPYVKPEGDES
jgi:hypothetical protein